MEELLLPCLNKQLFDIDCYGCGGQRSILLLLKGDFHGAFFYVSGYLSHNNSFRFYYFQPFL
ncbi:DUF2752 domain-containing protein [Gillisia marina]|uniref:DUF2752 domain-containing protein n=1 Tax=Gillisia marina TaxID=1167637 RepID=UPI001ED8E778|nr:DUF2752 domain-containing protein [Gillisia marina]